LGTGLYHPRHLALCYRKENDLPTKTLLQSLLTPQRSMRVRKYYSSIDSVEKCALAASFPHYEIAYRNLKKPNTAGRIATFIFRYMNIR
jgi:hypothetical protein